MASSPSSLEPAADSMGGRLSGEVLLHSGAWSAGCAPVRRRGSPSITHIVVGRAGTSSRAHFYCLWYNQNNPTHYIMTFPGNLRAVPLVEIITGECLSVAVASWRFPYSCSDRYVTTLVGMNACILVSVVIINSICRYCKLGHWTYGSSATPPFDHRGKQ